MISSSDFELEVFDTSGFPYVSNPPFVSNTSTSPTGLDLSINPGAYGELDHQRGGRALAPRGALQAASGAPHGPAGHHGEAQGVRLADRRTDMSGTTWGKKKEGGCW